jgi:hypothetical protein
MYFRNQLVHRAKLVQLRMCLLTNMHTLHKLLTGYLIPEHNISHETSGSLCTVPAGCVFAVTPSLPCFQLPVLHHCIFLPFFIWSSA